MHTVFINTSKENCPGQYSRLLLEKLLNDYSLIMLEEYVPLDQLSAHALALAEKIENEECIRENIRLVVYFENDVTQTTSPSSDTARVDAWMYAMTVKAHTDLLQVLHDKGKGPREMLFIFGERIKRVNTEKNAQYDSVLVRALWDAVALPACGDLLQFLNAEEKPEREKILEFLLRAGTDDKKLINNKDACYGPLIRELANTLHERCKKARYVEEEFMLADIRNALDAYTARLHEYAIRYNLPTKVYYVRQTLEYRDSFECSRSLCRRLLFLHLCADCTGDLEEKLLSLLKMDADVFNLDVYKMPEMDMQEMKKQLNSQLTYCTYPRYLGARPPEDLSDHLKCSDENGGYIIASSYPPPELTSDATFDSAVRTETLKKQVDIALDDIRSKSLTNADEIQKYLNLVEAEYARMKDKELEEVKFQRNDYERFSHTVSGEGNDEDNRIDHLKNFEMTLDKLKGDAEKKMLEFNGKIVEPRSIEASLKLTKQQTNFYFAQMKHDSFLLAICLLFVLAVALPYIAVRFGMFSSLPGIICFLITVFAAGAAAYISYWLLVRKYKKKIVKLMNQLCYEFNKTQEDNEECLKHYGEFLYNRVPRTYGLSRYEEMLSRFRENMQLRLHKITFHKMSLEDRINTIRSWMTSMDVEEQEMYDIQLEDVPILDPEKSCYENEDYYCVNADMVRKILLKQSAKHQREEEAEA